MSELESNQHQILQQVFANLSVAAFAIDKNHQVILWNNACETLTGLKASEVIGTRDHWRGFYKEPRPCLADTLLADGLEEAVKIYPHVQASSAVQGGLHAENWCLNRNGQKLYLLFEAGEIRDADGTLLAVVETLRDTTQPKLLNDIQQAVSAIMDLSINAKSMDELLERSLALVLDSPWMTLEEMGSIHLRDREHTKRLILKASQGLPESIANACRITTLGHCLCSQAVEKACIIFAETLDDMGKEFHEGLPSYGHYCVPIHAHGDVLGVMNIYTPEGHTALQGEIIFLENIAQALANGIERWLAEKAVQKAKANLSKAEGIAKMGSWSWALQEGQLHFSDGSLKLLSLSDQERDVGLESLLSRYDEAGQRHLLETLGAIALDEDEDRFTVEQTMINSSGEEWYILAMGEIIRNDQGKAIQIIGAMRDITSRKRAEEVTQLLGRVMGGSMNAIYIFDSRSLKMLQVSDGARRRLRYSHDELTELVFTELIPEMDPAAFKEDLAKLLNHEEERIVFETRMFNKEGKSRPVEIRLQLSHGEQPPVFVAVATNISKRLEEKEKLQKLAHFDALTGLPNRMLFNERMDQAISHGQRKGGEMALMFLDLDKFKQVNDTQGHDVGDMLLIEVSKRISGCLRSNDTVARLGGDEFTVILKDLASTEEPAIVAQKIIELMRTPFILGKHTAHIGTSVGISLFPQHGEDLETLTKRADLAMYAVKNSGRNNFRFYDPSMDET
ncbi:diguanylate cyclase domain-containing protein [Magnetococcus sp. PR-3]|uniref:diguanylate cyclase domain-containing protein n=1 Tax=Magnetococcus sp. PR-3 TaxID=3120355 RepID=UPI002FCE59B3